MFKLSLPVQRFVIASIILMILIIGADALADQLWIWQDQALNMISQSGTEI